MPDRLGFAAMEVHLFLCYRRTDGKKAADWLFENMEGATLDVQPDSRPGDSRLRVYLDISTPAVGDWTKLHRQALEQAGALLLVVTPGVYADFGATDWVHRELDWWVSNRRTAPILIETTGDG